MNTFALFTNTRAAFGDPAKESFVGIYKTSDANSLQHALAVVEQKINSGEWILPDERAAQIKKELERFGFIATTCQSIFVPIF